jgi:hypothetical protein
MRNVVSGDPRVWRRFRKLIREEESRAIKSLADNIMDGRIVWLSYMIVCGLQ